MIKAKIDTKTIAKAISWRVLGTVGTVLISFFFTKRLEIALSIGVGEFLIKIALFYLHDRLWERIKWQKGASV